MVDMRLTSSSAISLFTELAKGSKLQQLYLSSNDITDEACGVIVTSLKTNTSLVLLSINGNNISAEVALYLVQALHQNITLEELMLPFYPENIQKQIRSLQEEVNKSRKSRGYVTELNISY